METIKNKTKHVCQVLELGMNRWSTEDFEGIENTPYDIIMMDVMDACHYTFVKPYRLHRSSQVALVVKNLPANAGDITDEDLIPACRRFPGGGHGNSLQYSCLEKPMAEPQHKLWTLGLCACVLSRV